MKSIDVISAEHLKDHKVKIQYSDKKKNIVDFGVFLDSHPHPAYNHLKDINKFKQFWIEDGNIVWDNNWDFIFPVSDLYHNRLN